MTKDQLKIAMALIASLDEEVDIRSFTPVLEELLFGIEAARRNSNNTAGEWGSLSAMLQGLYHHAQCESKQRRLRRSKAKRVG